ncbi:hypothetical protein BB561_002291 [Smittium simulii]|uniref:Terpene cyclase/mutase family member n=1 Tax=Smittium simulii TaxID=133385 RepID=A0A2T9YR54_9FUNG|nr:hypothetical protein BB561_002291 [Smittium simulii]
MSTFKNNSYAEDFQTDLKRWRLRIDEGRHNWEYLENEQNLNQEQQLFLEKYWIGLPQPDSKKFKPASTTKEAAANGYEFYKQLQTSDGHWAGAYDGPMFITCGLVISNYICNITYNAFQRKELIRYLLNIANPDDGGWGLHFEGHSTVFGTVLNYVTLRILGLEPDHPAMIKARNTAHKFGSATAIPTWGKFWLSALGVYEWEGVVPFLPEPWLLPEFLWVFPGNFWVHTRAVYLGMCHIYGLRRTMPPNDLTRSLRNELYTQPYDAINWPAQQRNVSSFDRYAPETLVLRLYNTAVNVYEKFHSKSVRTKALEETLLQIHLEIENTKYLCIAPVNFSINKMVMYYEHGPQSKWFQGMVERDSDALWLCAQGLAGTGTNGSQLWDTAFMVQAAAETGLLENQKNLESMRKALDFLKVTQIKENPRDMRRCYRQATLGAWPFSTRDQGYTVSDTTAEGLKAVLMLQNCGKIQPVIEKKMLCHTVDILLGMQNSNGGFASYEKIRAPLALEALNASEVFGNIMTEYCYPECTTSVILGLSQFKKTYSDYRIDEINQVIDNAVKYIMNVQRKDGSWFGSWGICFTYATMFALKSLASVGINCTNSKKVAKACEFLEIRQNEDGGWGESYKSCETGEYVPHPKGSQVVNTSFALLGLMAAKYDKKSVLEKGVRLIMSRQQESGEWLQEGIEGVFNKNCMIAYPNYKFIFTIWALGKYSQLYE